MWLLCATGVPAVIIEWTQVKYICPKYDRNLKIIGIQAERDKNFEKWNEWTF